MYLSLYHVQVIKEKYRNGDGHFWKLPGGLCDAGEDIAKCAVREVCARACMDPGGGERVRVYRCLEGVQTLRGGEMLFVALTPVCDCGRARACMCGCVCECGCAFVLWGVCAAGKREEEGGGGGATNGKGPGLFKTPLLCL